MHDPDLEAAYRDGCYATLRLTAGMYHRFHAPHDCVVQQVDYISGDTADHDHEVEEARWMPLERALTALTYPGERRMIERALSKSTPGR